MSKQKVAFTSLKGYLPEGSFDAVLNYVTTYKVQLTITRMRKTVLGDYRHSTLQKGHRISVNGNLNKYSFLITLLHELAHLLTYEKYKNTVAPHGSEWKSIFGNVLSEFVALSLFPPPVTAALQKTIQSPAASSCADDQLLRVLQQYDESKTGFVFVESVAQGDVFEIPPARFFKRGEKLRKRYKCQEVATGKWYLFNGLYEVAIKN